MSSQSDMPRRTNEAKMATLRELQWHASTLWFLIWINLVKFAWFLYVFLFSFLYYYDEKGLRGPVETVFVIDLLFCNGLAPLIELLTSKLEKIVNFTNDSRFFIKMVVARLVFGILNSPMSPGMRPDILFQYLEILILPARMRSLDLDPGDPPVEWRVLVIGFVNLVGVLVGIYNAPPKVLGMTQLPGHMKNTYGLFCIWAKDFYEHITVPRDPADSADLSNLTDEEKVAFINEKLVSMERMREELVEMRELYGPKEDADNGSERQQAQRQQDKVKSHSPLVIRREPRIYLRGEDPILLDPVGEVLPRITYRQLIRGRR